MGTYEDFLNDFASIFGAEMYNEFLTVYSFSKQVEDGVYSIDNVDLRNPNSKNKYNKFISMITKKNPKNYTMKYFENMDTIDVFRYAMVILAYITGNDNRILEEFEEFTKTLIVKPHDEVLNGYSYKRTNLLDNTTSYEVIVPSITNVSAIVCLLHEFTHYHFQKNNMEEKKSYYDEILSILFEKLAGDLIEKLNLSKNVSQKIENVRLDCIKFHYTIQKSGIQDMKKYASVLKNESTEYMKKFTRDYENYYTKLAQSYGLGYLYAESLYVLYKTDEFTFHKKIREIFNGDLSLQEMLDYYNINAGNEEVYNNARKRISKVLR